MERELKFRVWNGSEMVTDVTVGKFGVFYVNPSNNGLDPNDSASITPFTTKYHEDTPVMQYVGLKDKNGKEIYEGDIVNFAVKEKLCPKCKDEKIKLVGACYCPRCGAKGEFQDFITTASVAFNEKGAWCYRYEHDEYQFTWNTYAAETYIEWTEVIGNVFQNPELINKATS